MDDSLKAQIEARGVLLATGGLGTAPLLMLAMRGLELTRFPYEHCNRVVLASTPVAHGAL